MIVIYLYLLLGLMHAVALWVASKERWPVVMILSVLLLSCLFWPVRVFVQLEMLGGRIEELHTNFELDDK